MDVCADLSSAASSEPMFLRTAPKVAQLREVEIDYVECATELLRLRLQP